MQVTYRMDASINNKPYEEIAVWTVELDESTMALPQLNALFMLQPMGALLGSNNVDIRMTRIH